MITACLLILCNSFNMQAQQTDNQLRVSYSTTKDTTITNSHHEPKSVLHREQVSHHFKDDRNKYLNQKAENKKDSNIIIDNTGVNNKRFEGSLYSEVNYGRHGDLDSPDLLDLPHFIINGHLHLGKGWTVVAELEYEQFYENKQWEYKFDGNFTSNKLYIAKDFSKAFSAKAGIIEVPVGIVNAGGPALTIYDPESESNIIPMTWHEGGASIYGSLGKWDYQIGGYIYTSLPLKNSQMLGGAIRLNYYPINGLRMGVSSYWGTPCKSQYHRQDLNFLGTDGLWYGAFDFDYQENGWIIDGSAIYCTDQSAKSAGIEIGYDFFETTEKTDKMELIPFMRYDGLFHLGELNFNKYTVGINFSPLKNLVVKGEYAIRHHQGGFEEGEKAIWHSFDIGVSYTWEF
ncbi:hypothetical protein SAMN04487899_10817 [Segatella bryantii]|nr:hypothetical protein SAMN04487899_10817 [Segatella bryantii]